MLLQWTQHVDLTHFLYELSAHLDTHTHTHTHTHLQNKPKLRHAVTWQLIPSNTPRWFKGLNKSRASVTDAAVDLIHTDKLALSNLISPSLILALRLTPSLPPSLHPSSGQSLSYLLSNVLD